MGLQLGKLQKLMVKTQLMNRDISDKSVLDAMGTVPRHLFIPPDLINEAYNDHPLPIGHQQTISQPYIVALMTQALELTRISKVLEIGTGCGYQTAILASIVETVYSVEIIPELTEIARNNLKNIGIKNVQLKVCDGYDGWLDEAPFDRIIITAAPPKIPPRLINQLTTNGIMVVPVGSMIQNLLWIKKRSDDTLHKRNITAVRFVPMTGKALSGESSYPF